MRLGKCNSKNENYQNCLHETKKESINYYYYYYYYYYNYNNNNNNNDNNNDININNHNNIVVSIILFILGAVTLQIY